MILFLLPPVRYPCGGHDFAGGGCVGHLIIEEDMGAEGFEYLGLADASKEEGLIDTYIPGAKSSDDSFVGRCTSCSYDGGSYGRFHWREFPLQI